MTDEQFVELCSEHPDDFVEVTAEGEIVIRPPEPTYTGVRNAIIGCQLGTWARTDGRGISTGCDAGFVLPNGARRSADDAWTLRSRLRALTKKELHTFWRLCPDLVVELSSEMDDLPKLRAKMREWVANGAQLAWLIDPERRAVEIFRPDREPETLLGPDSVTGEGPVEGFRLDLRPVWDPLGSAVR